MTRRACRVDPKPSFIEPGSETVIEDVPGITVVGNRDERRAHCMRLALRVDANANSPQTAEDRKCREHHRPPLPTATHAAERVAFTHGLGIGTDRAVVDENASIHFTDIDRAAFSSRK